MKKIIVVILAIAMVISTTACSGLTSFKNFKAAFFPGDQKVVVSTIKIGVYEPLSGKYKDAAKSEISGIELAHELNPTVYGLNVELVYADNKSSMYDGETAIANLLDQNPVLVLGSYGEVLTLLASKYLEEKQTPGITMSATNPLITKNNEYFFRATYSEENQGAALADFVYLKQGRKKVAVVKIGSDDTVTNEITAFTERINELSGEEEEPIVANISLLADQIDYSTVFDRLRNSGATATFLALPSSVAKNFITQACNSRLRYMLFFGTRSWDNPEMIEYAQANYNYNIAFCSAETTSDSDTSKEFNRQYQEKYGTEPSGYASIGYDAYMLAVKAITEAYDEGKWSDIPQGTAVRDKLLEIKAYDGASGIISYNGSNEAVKTIPIHHYLGYSMEQYIEDIANLAAQVENPEDPETVEIDEGGQIVEESAEGGEDKKDNDKEKSKDAKKE